MKEWRQRYTQLCQGPGCIAGAAGSSGAWGLVWNTSGPGAEAPEVILRKGVGRNEKHISKECVKSTAWIK